MAVSKKVNTMERIKIKYGFGILLFTSGLLFHFLNIGNTDFGGFPSLGVWILFIAVLYTVIVTFTAFRRKEKIIDERMEHIGYKASRVTTLVFILLLFCIIVLDGIYTLTWRYYLAASSLVCIYIFTYLISYWILDRYN